MGWEVAMESNFTLNADIDLLSKDILNGIKEIEELILSHK